MSGERDEAQEILDLAGARAGMTREQVADGLKAVKLVTGRNSPLTKEEKRLCLRLAGYFQTVVRAAGNRVIEMEMERLSAG